MKDVYILQTPHPFQYLLLTSHNLYNPPPISFVDLQVLNIILPAQRKRVMASSRNYYPNGLKIAVIVMLIFSLTSLPSISVGPESLRDSESWKQRKMVLGSRPPRCINRCLSCRPCMAALVIPPHHKNGFKVSSSQGDESYYLLSWKCRCGDKLFPP